MQNRRIAYVQSWNQENVGGPRLATISRKGGSENDRTRSGILFFSSGCHCLRLIGPGNSANASEGVETGWLAPVWCCGWRNTLKWSSPRSACSKSPTNCWNQLNIPESGWSWWYEWWAWSWSGIVPNSFSSNTSCACKAVLCQLTSSNRKSKKVDMILVLTTG